jgi:hypothetical protein
MQIKDSKNNKCYACCSLLTFMCVISEPDSVKNGICVTFDRENVKKLLRSAINECVLEKGMRCEWRNSSRNISAW